MDAEKRGGKSLVGALVALQGSGFFSTFHVSYFYRKVGHLCRPRSPEELENYHPQVHLPHVFIDDFRIPSLWWGMQGSDVGILDLPFLRVQLSVELCNSHN